MSSIMKEDWIECTLGEVCKKALKVKRNEMPLSDKIKYLDIGSIDNNLNQIISHKDYCWEDAPSRAQQIIKKGDVLFSTVRTYLKNIAKVTNEEYQDEICSSGFTVLRVKKNVLDSDYLFFRSISTEFLNSLSKLQTGTSYPAVRDKDVFAQIIPLPPFVEQRAIVNKIEELFSSLDSGIAELKKAQGQLVIYRQAVLKKAFEVIKETKPLKECGDWKGGGTPSKQIKEYWENGTIPWVSSRDVKTKEIVDTERHITELAIPNSSTKWIEKDSLLFVMRSGILRRIFPIAIAKRKLCVNQDIQTVFLDKNWDPEYVYWFLMGNESNIRYSCSKDGTTVESIDANSLKSYLIPICSIQEQQAIVREIESRLSVCDAVEENIANSLEKSQALRQSILKKAFEGKLLNEEEIAKCKADKEYEPASVLLEKIKAEKKQK